MPRLARLADLDGDIRAQIGWAGPSGFDFVPVDRLSFDPSAFARAMPFEGGPDRVSGAFQGPYGVAATPQRTIQEAIGQPAVMSPSAWTDLPAASMAVPTAPLEVDPPWAVARQPASPEVALNRIRGAFEGTFADMAPRAAGQPVPLPPPNPLRLSDGRAVPVLAPAPTSLPPLASLPPDRIEVGPRGWALGLANGVPGGAAPAGTVLGVPGQPAVVSPSGWTSLPETDAPWLDAPTELDIRSGRSGRSASPGIRSDTRTGGTETMRARPEDSAVAQDQRTIARIRRGEITPELESRLDEAVRAVYGPGHRVQVYSGGQPAGGRRGRDRTGSTRHNDGHAADFYVIGPDGTRLTGDRLAPMIQYWTARGYGSVGAEMTGGGLHFDTHRDRGRFWWYNRQPNAAQVQAINRGLAGEMPEIADPSMVNRAARAEEARRRAPARPTSAAPPPSSAVDVRPAGPMNTPFGIPFIPGQR